MKKTIEKIIRKSFKKIKKGFKFVAVHIGALVLAALCWVPIAHKITEVVHAKDAEIDALTTELNRESVTDRCTVTEAVHILEASAGISNEFTDGMRTLFEAWKN